MYNENFCAFADAITLDTGANSTGNTPRAVRTPTYAQGIFSVAARRNESAGAAVGDDLFEDQLRIEEVSKILVVLESNFFEDYQRSLNQDSRGSFIHFMRAHHDARIPLLGVESTGKLVATWKSDAGCLSIRFVGLDQLHYAISLQRGDQVSRTWGESSTTDVFSIEDAKRLVTS